MGSSPASPTSSVPGKKRSAKTVGLDSAEGWMPKIRIINFDPKKKPGAKTTNPVPTAVKSEKSTSGEPSPTTTSQTPLRITTIFSQSPGNAPPVAPTAGAIAQSDSPFSEFSIASLNPQPLLFNGVTIYPSDPLYPLLTCAKFCENCRTAETSYWRTDESGRDHCNPCGLHWTKHHLPRPIDPNHKGAVGNYACQICPTRKHARRREEYHGIILCNACTDYWKHHNAVRPLIAFAKRVKGDKEMGIVRQTKKCGNCGTGRASKWMIGEGGEDNCAECGLFWMYHKTRRPLGVGVGVDGIGPRRESRGPKIMDSRKRRMGSVLTGSGSESEEEDTRMDGLEKVDNFQGERQVICHNDNKMETPEPADESPVSLLTLAVLARKIQLHAQELSMLNSPLLERPAISSLLSVIDPVIQEITPLSTSDVPRSTLSKSVLKNLLAHTISAEAEAATSEEERLHAIEDDWQYGPEEVGENIFLHESIGQDSIEAAKGLIELFKSEDDEVLQNDVKKVHWPKKIPGREIEG